MDYFELSYLENDELITSVRAKAEPTNLELVLADRVQELMDELEDMGAAMNELLYHAAPLIKDESPCRLQKAA